VIYLYSNNRAVRMPRGQVNTALINLEQ